VEELLIIGVICLTAAASYLVFTRKAGLRAQGLLPAATAVAEGVGIGMIFLLLNLGIGLTFILLVRSLTGVFLSAYLLDDVAWPIFSFLEGLLFWAWLSQSRRSSTGQQ
jgi:hypothetical protein